MVPLIYAAFPLNAIMATKAEETKADGMNRVCMIVMSLYPNDERVRREAAALERAGIAVDVLCQRGAGQTEVEQFGKVTAYRVMNQATKENLAQYIWVSSRFAGAAFLKLQRLAAQHPYKVIQAHNMPDFLVFVGLFHRLLGRPVVLDLHDLSVELYKAKWNGRKATMLMPLVKMVERLSCCFASQLITTSDGFKDRLIRRGVAPEKVTLVLNTPDPHLFEFQPDRKFHPIHKGLRLLYHGTVTERFGLAQAIEAVALLKDRIPRTTLNIFGKYDPSYRERLEREIKELGLTGQVSLGGWCNPRQIGEIIRGADIGLVPYLKDEFMNLALSTKTFEYATTGLPVVASRLSSIASHFDDQSIQFFEPGNAADMADKIHELSVSPDRRRSMVQHAHAALDGISGSVMEQRYLGMMRKLIGVNGHG
jgi:glycosyltransferase involved in cell wall biosynthesis